ncbi:7747_t:CDS:1, partial [Gigaspora rosea]
TINIWYNELLKDESTAFVAQLKEADETIVDNVELKALKPEEISKKSNNIGNIRFFIA